MKHLGRRGGFSGNEFEREATDVGSEVLDSKADSMN